MANIARRAAIALGAFVLAWVAAALGAIWLFGSGNFLVWVIAAAAGVGAYLAILWRDRRAGSRRPDAVEET
jgi:hypothetical protein